VTVLIAIRFWVLSPRSVQYQIRAAGIILPRGASAIACNRDALLVEWVHLRFTVSSDQLAAFFQSNPWVPGKAPLARNGKIIQEMQQLKCKVEWWNPADAHDPSCAFTEYLVKDGNGDVSTAKVYIACDEVNGQTTVYLLRITE